MKHHTNERGFRFWWLLGIFLAMLPLHVPPIFAATFTVTKESDDDGPCDVDDCALREAILAANALPGMDEIFLPYGSYQLSIVGPSEAQGMTGDLDITDSLELRGEDGAFPIIIGDGSDRVLSIGASTVILENIIITGGFVPGPGAGILIGSSTVTLINCLITQNHATVTDGGGIASGPGVLQLIGTTVSDNSAAGRGGGIFRLGLGPSLEADITLVNSTVSGNSAYEGGGIYGVNDGDLVLESSTIANNTASFRGDAVLTRLATGPIWTNTLVVGRCSFPNGAVTTSYGGNIESPGATCFLTHPTDRMNVPDPGLGILAANDGPTPTHALLLGSPAIDSAEDALCQPTDQRGRLRPADGDGDGVAGCDVGAFERVVAAEVEIPTLGSFSLLALALLFALTAVRVLLSRSSQ